MRVVRQRQSFRRKTRGALVMHRMSAVGITGCAALIGLLQLVANFDAVIQAMNHEVASKILIAALSLMLVGVFWMMNLGQEEST